MIHLNPQLREPQRLQQRLFHNTANLQLRNVERLLWQSQIAFQRRLTSRSEYTRQPSGISRMPEIPE